MGRRLSIDRRIPACVLCLFAISFENIPAQTAKPIHVAERIFLETIQRDTTSRLVCYLKGFFLTEPPEGLLGHLILLKDGKRNMLVREASDRVYEIISTNHGPILRRVDSSHQYGDDFRAIAFVRKDTLYKYGGYGFWRTRDFFSRFDPGKGTWEFVPSLRTIPGKYRMYQFDKSEDAFYMTGGDGWSEQQNVEFSSSDSVYKFNFSERTWRPIGWIREEHRDAVKRSFEIENVDYVHTEYGVVFISDPLILFDFRGNRVVKAASEIADRTQTIRYRRHSSNPRQTLLFHMGDSLHMIINTNGNAEHLAVPLTASDFDPSNSTTFYDVSAGPESDLGVSKMAIATVVLFGLVVAYLWRGKRLSAFKKSKYAPIREQQSDNHTPAPSAESQTEVFSHKSSRFLDMLTSTERELLGNILTLSLQGKSMDIESFNRSIGVSHKEDSVKKTRRSLILSKINDAYSLIIEADSELVLRSQDPDDRRRYRYLVAGEHISTLRSIYDTAAPENHTR